MPAGTPPFAPLPPATDPLPSRADVIVVGGGLPGLVAAVELARGGANVAVIEASPVLGAGASGRQPGLAVTSLAEHPWRTVTSLGRDEAGALFRFARAGLDALHAVVPFDRSGVLWAARDDREVAEVARSVEALADLGLPVQAWDAARVAEAVGTPALGPGFWCPGEGAFDPPAVVHGLSDALAFAGVPRVGRAAARAVEDHDGALRVRTTLGDVACEAVVLAAETGLPALVPALHDVLVPVREQAVAVAGRPPLRCALRTGQGWTTARATDAAVVVAGMRWASPDLGIHADDTPTPEVQARLEGTARGLWPEVGEVVARWSWRTAHGCDGLPLVGPLPGDPRLLVCAGFSGLEPSLGVAGARAVVAGLLGGQEEVPRCLSSARFLA